MNKSLLTLLLLGLTCTLLYSSCSTGWTTADEKDYTNSCKMMFDGQFDTTQLNNYCDCSLQVMKSKYKSKTDASNHATEAMNSAEMKKCLTEAIKQ